MKKVFSIVILLVMLSYGRQLSKLGFTGNGNEAMVDSLGLGRWYALEGNYVDLRPFKIDYEGPNSLRPDRLLPPTGTRVIREVAKLDVRAEGDPNYISHQLVTDAYPKSYLK